MLLCLTVAAVLVGLWQAWPVFLKEGEYMLPAQARQRLQAAAFINIHLAAGAFAVFAPALWWWVMHCLGPLSIPLEKLVWVYQHPVERVRYVRRRTVALTFYGGLYGLLAGSFAGVMLYPGGSYAWVIPVISGIFTCPMVTWTAIGYQVRSRLKRPTLPQRHSLLARFRYPELAAGAGKLAGASGSILGLDTAGLGRVLFPVYRGAFRVGGLTGLENLERGIILFCRSTPCTRWYCWCGLSGWRCDALAPYLPSF